MKTLKLIALSTTLLLTQAGSWAHDTKSGNKHHHHWQHFSCHKKHYHGHHCHHHPAPTCKAFDQKIYPVRGNSQHLYFNVDSLKMFLDPKVYLKSLDLYIRVQGPRRILPFLSKNKSKYEAWEKDDLAISINGIKVHGLRGKRVCEFRQFDNWKNESEYVFDLDSMALNGAEGVAQAIQRIISDNGEVKISLHGKKKIVLKNAYLEIKGNSGNNCPVPPTPPTTTPTTSTPSTVAPVTVIQSVDPQGNIVALNSMSINFSADQTSTSFKCSLDNATAVACTSPQVYSNLSNGSHSFKVVATNSQGQTDAVGASYSWKVDSVAPNVSITNAASLKTLTNNTGISVAFTSSTAVSFQCSIDDGSYSTCSSPVSYSALTEGPHKVAIKGFNSAGKSSTNPAVFQWIIDVTAPQTNFDSITPTLAVSAINSKSFSFSANETSTYECNIDQAGFSICVSPLNLAGLADGAHTVAVRATDLAGNIGGEANYSWAIDSTAPVVTIINNVPAQGLNNTKNISVEFEANEDVIFNCKFDGIVQTNCSSPFSAEITVEGPHSFSVTAVDAAGNVSNTVGSSWIMDFTLPQIAWGEILPSSASFINSTSVQANVTSNEVVSLSAALNGVDLGPTPSPVVLDQLVEGVYTLVVKSVDSAQNVGNVITHQFAVDLTAPVIDVSGSAAALSNQSSNLVILSANEDVAYMCSLNNAGYSACSSPLNLTGLAEGNHVLLVQATDLAGNVSAVRSLNWSVDLTAPVSTLVPVRSANDSVNFSFSANETVQRFECSLDGSAFEECNSPLSLSNLGEGDHKFEVRSIDLAGNIESASNSYGWKVNGALATNLVSITSNGQGTNLSFSFSSNVSGATFKCSVDGATAVNCTSPYAISGLADGNHKFKVFAIDSWGGVDSSGAIYNWVTDTVAPIVSNITKTVTTNSMTINWTTNEPTTSQITWGLATTANISTPEDTNLVTSHSVTVTGLATFTIYSYIIKGKDAAGNAYATARTQLRTAQ